MTFNTKNADGSKVFKKVMMTEAAIKSAKNRLTLYLEFMKNYRATKPTHNSGGDNEPYSEILDGLEDLYDLHESFKNTTTEKRTAAADTRMRERAEGDAIRNASLGLFVAARNNEEQMDEEEVVEQPNNENDNPNPVAVSVATTKKKNNRRMSSGSGHTSAGEADYQMVESIFKKYYTEEKKEEKRCRMEYNERRLALEEQRAADERASRQMQHDMMMSLIANLSKK
jgi:hypothetical protein